MSVKQLKLSIVHFCIDKSRKYITRWLYSQLFLNVQTLFVKCRNPEEGTNLGAMKSQLSLFNSSGELMETYITYPVMLRSLFSFSLSFFFISVVLVGLCTYLRFPVHSYVQCPISKHFWQRTCCLLASLGVRTWTNDFRKTMLDDKSGTISATFL